MSTAKIYGGAPYNAPSYTATSTPGFVGDGSGLTNLPASQITLNNPDYAVITNGSSQLTTEQYLSTVRGGTGVNSSAFTGVAKVNAGTWSASAVTGSDIASATITGSNIAAATIAGSNISAATITGSNISAATITGSNIASGTVTGTNIAATTITDANIATNAAIADTKLATISTAGKVANSATTAATSNAPNTIVLRDGTGSTNVATLFATLVTAPNVTSSFLVQTPNANAQTTIQSAYVQTTNATATTLFSLATISAGAHGTTYLISCNISLGDVTGGSNTGTYQFQFKVKNLGGTLTLSSIISNTTILDGTLTGTGISVTSSSANALVQVTGIAATTIAWSGTFTITQVNF